MIKQPDLFFEADNADFLKKTSLELTRRNGSFSLEDIVDAFEREDILDYEEWELEEDLLEDTDIVALPGKKAIRFFNREAYFENAEFLIKPTEFEVKNAVLFVGHRLLPFVPEEDAYVFKLLDKNGKELESKQVETPFFELDMCYSLYAPEAGAINAIDDLDFDELFDPNPNPKLKVAATGLDLESFISESGFVAGDYIKVRLKNYAAAECEIERCPVSKISSNLAATTKWQGKFEAGLKKAVNRQKEIGRQFENEDLIGAAFYYAGKALLKDPAYSWLDAVRASKKFSFQTFDDRLYVWEKDKLQDYMRAAINLEEAEYAEYMDDLNEEYDEFPDFGDPDELEFNDIARIMGFNLNEDILIAYMLDALHFNGNLHDNVIKRCFDDRVMAYPELTDRFAEILDELWDEARDMPLEVRALESAKLRHELLELKDRETAFLRALDKSENFDHKNLPSGKLVTFVELSATLDDFIINLGLQPFESNKEFKTVEKMAKALLNKFEPAIEKLEEEFLKQDNANSTDAYVFKVKLSHDKRTYREIAIRGDQTFAQLHETIFTAFDRYDDHLYSFFFTTQGGKSRRRFADAPEITDPRNMEDCSHKEMYNAEETRINDFPMTPGRKFEYLFDFGDNWLHEVELLSVNPTSPDGKYPAVVKRKGASPEQYG
jgi:hypothetical protein